MTKRDYYDKLYQDRLERKATMKASQDRETFIRNQNRFYDKTVSSGFSLLKIVALIILTSVVFRFLMGSDKTTTFTGFLNWIGSENFSVVNGAYIDNSLPNEWLLFDGFRLFLNAIITVFDILSWLARNLVNGIWMGGKFVAYLFGITGISKPA